MKKLFAVLFAVVLVFGLVACASQPAHVCESVCPECGKCLDAECGEAACADKCAGHVPPHVCEHKCEVCGKCTDDACKDPACADKCEGHLPPHVCESKCETCGKCLNAECEEDACKDKCAGHHVCESKCETCGKCTNPDCTEDACKDKCGGHHVCESKCPVCRKCTNTECADKVCADKCAGHTYTEKMLLLVATHNVNFRETGITTTLAIAEDMPYVLDFADDGKDLDLTMGDIANYKGGEVPRELVGGPVIAVYADGKYITEFKPIEGKTLSVHQYEVTVTEDGKYMYNGQALNIDTAALIDGFTSRTAVKSQGLYWRCGDKGAPINVDRYGLQTEGDDTWQLYDTDNDGDFDFAVFTPLMNSGLVVSVDEDRINIAGSFGSAMSMYTWANGTTNFSYIFMCEEFEIKEGDRVDFAFSYGLTCEPHSNKAPAQALIYGKSEKHTGKLEACQGSAGDITCTIGGVAYKWAPNMNTGDPAADGENGENAGRGLMVSDNIGKTVNFWLDGAGNIVVAELAE